MKGKDFQQGQWGVFRTAEGRLAVLLRRAQSQPGHYRQRCRRRRGEPFQLVCLQQCWSAVVEIIGSRDNRKQQADKAYQGDGRNRAAPVRTGQRDVPGAEHQ
ncbi:MAG TPA: hypothetical protein VKE93_20770 [Candidatus Angelobacter sp.]|nr:hypothetical protein [Candidatus Angelobacter sp.]